MVKMSGGEALVKSLVREGVEVIFGVPGIQVYGIVAALRDEPGIRMITTRHEQATTYMADGYARTSGKPGVALVVPGVGLYNAASGIATAYSRSSPILVIAGQIPRGMIGKNLGAVHEILDQPDVVRPVTKWRRQALRPREIPDAVTEAFRQMRTGRPRPVLIEVPPEAGVEQEDVQLRNPAPVSRIVPSPEQLREVARLIAEAILPVIYAGGGVASSDAEEALAKLAEATNIPVITSSGGKGTIPDSHPLCYGSCFSPRGEMQEMNQLYEVMQSADVVVGIGARFSLGNPGGESSTLVNINVDDAELTRIQSNCIPLHGDAKATIEALMPHLIDAGAGNRPSPAQAVQAARRLIAYYDIRLREPQYPVLEAVQRAVPEDTFIVWDITQFGYYARTHYQVNHPKTYLDPATRSTSVMGSRRRWAPRWPIRNAR
jgi:acetolactate synthase-1/2/3 large subunit